MLDTDLARLWSAQPDFLAELRRWHWCREAHAVLLLRRCAQADASAGMAFTVNRQNLARGFWAWAAQLDGACELEVRDAVDMAHFACGALLSQWLLNRPLAAGTIGADADGHLAVRAMTSAALTLLQAWRVACGAGPLEGDMDLRMARHWSSFVENVHEDPCQAIAFLDLFSGRPPVWRYPSYPRLRPAFASLPNDTDGLPTLMER